MAYVRATTPHGSTGELDPESLLGRSSAMAPTLDNTAPTLRWASWFAPAGLVGIVFLALRAGAPQAPPRDPVIESSRDERFRVDPATIRYRFEVPPAGGFEAAGELAALEARVRAG